MSDPKKVLEAVFWDQANAGANTGGEMLPFDPASGNLPVIDTGGGSVTIEFGDRFVVDWNGEKSGAVVVRSQMGVDGKPDSVKIKTDKGDTIILSRGRDLIYRLGLEK